MTDQDRIINLVVGSLTILLILVTLISAFVFPQLPPKPLNIFFAVCISLSSITACILDTYWVLPRLIRITLSPGFQKAQRKLFPKNCHNTSNGTKSDGLICTWRLHTGSNSLTGTLLDLLVSTRRLRTEI
ncbi:transmembrane protein 243 isoform X2 [Mesocricetus auratus]|uniref:Transmembrane protein 243 isoform X2 n=1 Tax=Mesocricetus auratus TaxID=10036 RepID=A0ABM2WA18_MESAU|nr:transmembrane protein 243 isoform X2 [Mesocricetus auratus]